MIYQIVFSVSYPNYTDLTEIEIRKSFIKLLTENTKKEDRFQTHDTCWFISSELLANEISSMIVVPNINIIITQINHNIAGVTAVTFWKWLKEKNLPIEEVGTEEMFVNNLKA